MSNIFIPKCISFFSVDLAPETELTLSFKPSDHSSFSSSVARIEITIEPSDTAVADSILARYYIIDGVTPSDGIGFGAPLKAFEMITVSEFEAIRNFRIKADDGKTHKLWVAYYNY